MTNGKVVVPEYCIFLEVNQVCGNSFQHDSYSIE